MTEFTYVETDSELKKAADEWSNENILGIDIECENNLHHYGEQISLFQISTRKKNWLVDAIPIKNFEPLIEVLINPNIRKLFHDVSFDLQMIEREFKCKTKGIFDTELAAELLGKKEIGLGSLLKEYFGIEKESKFQKADWLKRPLTKEMREYAIKDSLYLIKLHDLFVNDLKEKNRLEWADEEFRHIESKDYYHKSNGFMDMKGLRTFSETERAILKRLYTIRERLAKKVGRPVHFILNTKKMKDLAVKPPTLKQWQQMKGVHPIVKKNAKQFDEAVQKGLKEKLVMKQLPKKRYSNSQRKHIELLNETRLKIAEKMEISGHLILNKDQIQDIVLTGNNRSLRDWQKKLLCFNNGS